MKMEERSRMGNVAVCGLTNDNTPIGFIFAEIDLLDGYLRSIGNDDFRLGRNWTLARTCSTALSRYV